MCFERGKCYAVIGQNRSGKSTLMQILCKLIGNPAQQIEDPEDEEYLFSPEGHIDATFIGSMGDRMSDIDSSNSELGDPIRPSRHSFIDIPRTRLRRIIAYMSQRPFIFPATIEDNIRVGNFAATVRL